MVYSQRTYELDAQTTVSALRDVIQKQLNAGQLQQQMNLIRQANGKTVDSTQARELLRKALQKNEADSVIEAYNSLDTVNMPAGNTCLLYTSDAADDLTRVDLGGRRIIKKKK